MPLYGDAKRKYQRKWTAARRAAFYAGKRCEFCGSRENLELDHKDPKQKVSHRIWNWSAARREVEIAKCQILCEDCHKEKTKEDSFEMLATTSKYFLCGQGHDLHKVGWYDVKASDKAVQCRYCKYLNRIKTRPPKHGVLGYTEYIEAKGANKSFTK